MGAGKKTQSFNPNETFPSPWQETNVIWARNLNKNQLGGVIFGCTNSTMEFCLKNQLFGLPGQHFLYVQNIEPRLPLFLFNYSDRKLHGIYEAASSGKMNIDSYAWTDGSERTKYPAQVQIYVQRICQPLTEQQFKPIIIDNYYNQTHFRFELDHAQASKLIAKFSPLPVASRSFIPQNPQRWKPVVKFPSSKKEVTDDFANCSVGTSAASDDSLSLDGNNQLTEASLCNPIVQPDEKGLIYMKLKELALDHEYSGTNINNAGHLINAAPMDAVDLERERHDNAMDGVKYFDSLDYPAIITQLFDEMEVLKAFNQEQTQKMQTLEMKLAEAEQEIYRLNRHMMLQSTYGPSMTVAGNDTLIESPEKSHLNLDESIFIVGGYDASSCLSALDCFSPSNDVLISLEPMSCARSYASVASLNGELYVCGGGNGSMWYDTVESYNATNHQWTLRPSLNVENGSLAVAALNGKLYAVGGANGLECYSAVEMYDPILGRWISSRSMLEKRFALAAVALNGAIYAVGGFDGCDYLKSAERFDPRECCWSRIRNMDTNRGSHSLVAMNEKLYSIGGYDGTKTVSTVEIYEPRTGTWMTGEPMNYERGYLAAAILKDSIFVIGGAKANEDAVDTIECYKEGEGWQVTNLKAVGKRYFAAAIVLGGDC